MKWLKCVFVFNTFVDRLKKDIVKNGIQEPIKYVVYNGEKYIVDGHHRFIAAKRLRIEEIPSVKVELPYGNYKTSEDLFGVHEPFN